MQTGNLFTRGDTFFGVCEALGQDLGFNPNLLRVTLGVLVLWNPVVVLSAYAGAAVLVAATRFAFPDRRASSSQPSSEQPAAPALDGANDEMQLPLAA